MALEIDVPTTYVFITRNSSQKLQITSYHEQLYLYFIGL